MVFFRKYFYLFKFVEEKLEKFVVEIKERRMYWRKKYFILIDYGIVEVEVVRVMYNIVFCVNCMRLRVIFDGKFKICLLRNNDFIDFFFVMRNGVSDEEIVEIFKRVVFMRELYWK